MVGQVAIAAGLARLALQSLVLLLECHQHVLPAGEVRVLLSRISITSAMLRAGRWPVPEKMTSSISEPRICLAEVSPITHFSASTRFDLPQPLGPTMPVSPVSIASSVGSTKDLK